MKTTISEPQSWKRVVNVEVPDEEVQAAFGEKLKKYRQTMKLPGFRPGKVPEALIRQRFGESIRAEIIDDIVQKTYREALEENKIVPVATPKMTDIKADAGAPLTFSIETEIDPPFEATGYQKLKVKVSPKKIKDGDVEDAVKNIVERLATFNDVDRPVKKGDFVKLEYLKVVIDGEEQGDIKNPTYPVEVGGDNSLKEFHKGVIGHAAGETIDLTIKFPKDYSEANVAGKTGEFTIKLTAVQEKVLPEINEEFLKKVGDFADETAFREKVRGDLEAEALKQAREEAHNKAIDSVIKENDFEVPPARIDQFISYMEKEAMRYRRPDEPAPQREELAEQYHDLAVRSIKRQRIIDAIAEKEKIRPTQKEVDAEIQRIAAAYRQDFETLKQTLRQNGTTLRIRDEIRERKTLDYLIGEYTPEAEKPKADA
ncbi:MAG: trigger factor [Chitinispirillaceae bacterium]|nr:trigger factor [Chitinispirillaceae bacterium]